MTPFAKQMMHPKEVSRSMLMTLAGAIIWAMIAVVIVAGGPGVFFVVVLYGVLIALMVSVTTALVRAYMFGHYVMVGPQQFPKLHQMVVDGAREVGLSEVPTTFVYNSSGSMNAMALRMFGKPYVWLTSDLIDSDTDAQIRFVIGHELGHHALGHLAFMPALLRWPGYVVPFLGPAYSRARELSCDRIGAALAHDAHASRSALQMLASGSASLNEQMNPDAFQAQEDLVPPIAGTLLNLVSSYPRLSKRVEEVSAFLVSGETAQSHHAPLQQREASFR